MPFHQLTFTSVLESPVEKVFAWHEAADAINHLTPPWQSIRVVERTGGIDEAGSRLTFRIMLFGSFFITWVAEHTAYVQNQLFEDVQRKGPFAAWVHQHRFEAMGPSQCRMTDRISYRLPLGIIGEILLKPFIEDDLKRMFRYRHQVLHQTFDGALEQAG